MLGLPNNSHVYLLYSLVRQINNREQLYVRKYRFFYGTHFV